MDRALTRILLSWSSVKTTTTTADDDADGFCRWPEVWEARSLSTEYGSAATREVVETARPVVYRYSNNTTGMTCLSHSDLIEGGCVDRLTFCYVPDNGMYASFKATAKANQGKSRRYYRLGRGAKTKSTQGGDGGSVMTRQESSDDQTNTSTPRQDDVQQQGNNETSCNDDELPKQPDTVDVHAHHCECTSKEKDTKLSRGRRQSETKAATCSGDDVRPDPQQRSDSRRIKTWLYAFLPPLATTQIGHVDVDPHRGNTTEAHDHGLPASKSRNASGGRKDRLTRDEQHRTAVNCVLQTRLEDQEYETRTASHRQRQPPSTASGAVVHRQRRGLEADFDRRRRQRLAETPVDDCYVYVTETCLLPHFSDCSHYHQVYSNFQDALTPRSDYDHEEDHDNKSYSCNIDGDDVGDNDDGDDHGNVEKESEVLKSALESLNSRLCELETLQTRDQLQLSLKGDVVDIHRRRQESCKS